MKFANFFRRLFVSPTLYPGIPFSVPARAALQTAQRVAEGWNHDYVGTEHLLAALVRNSDSRAAAILDKLGMTRKKLDALLAQVIQQGPWMVALGRLPHTPRLRKAVDRAYQSLSGRVSVDTAHLLLGLLQVDDGVGAQLLEPHEITAAAVQAALADAGLPQEPTG